MDNLTLFIISMIVLVPLTMVKDIKKFAWTHVALTTMIIVSLISICYYALENAF